MPLRASTPISRSPISSRPSTPGRQRRRHDGPVGVTAIEAMTAEPAAEGSVSGSGGSGGGYAVDESSGGFGNHAASTTTALESRATAWDEAERAKFTVRYKTCIPPFCEATVVRPT
ncbi:hypothetical protein E2562_032178 [Oryza meyeriana var. granulata]|uniref:Uncharacterized protein n=1 Tax=Oryza meyeriana var. granulata TaxID=110450 RepID=A0A6G1E5S6_9ORYZ|nr:hypothetical protein E2562_032178 [Oryza meyeriana var. granulata]